MKIQTKTTILFTTLTTAVFLVLTVTVYYFSNQFAYNDFYKRLELRARISAKFRFEEGHVSTATFKLIQKQYLERLPDEESYIVRLLAPGNPQAPVPAKLPLSYLKNIESANGNTVYYQDHFVHYAGLLYKDNTGNFLVIESAVNSYGAEIMQRMKNILIITLLASIAVIYTVGMYLSRKTFQPFRYMTNRVKAISERNLHLRLEKQEGADEVAELVNTFNNMLDRLETAFETQNNFVSNASHELRTPLTAIVGEADYALSQERVPADYRQSLVHIMQQASKLQHLTKGLLFLAQTGFDGKKQMWEQLRTDQLLFDVKEHIDDLFPNRVVIHLPHLPDDEAKISIYGNVDLLRIAIGNIIVNACKYSREQPVTVELTFDNKEISITVSDKGIGIPPEELSHIYDPFFRGSNATTLEGYGIGMPLSRNIIRMHGGRIAVDSTVNKGTVVAVVLPVL